VTLAVWNLYVAPVVCICAWYMEQLGTCVEAFGNTLRCRVEINSDELACIQCFRFLLLRSCVGVTASLNWSYY
jgi:hypothetical protein